MRTILRSIIFVLLLSIPVSIGWSTENISHQSSLERAKGLLTANKPVDALAALSSFKPSHEEMSAYHYAFARALLALKQPYDAVEHARLAYVFAQSLADRERLLLERADIYAAMGYYPEAAICYEVFLKLFPKSSFSERAELGIAEARTKSGEFHLALAHYEKAGSTIRSVTGKANTLQALGRTAEAHDLYHALIEQDPKTVSSSPDTIYSIGENYRQLGLLKDARVYYESVKDPLLKYRAAIGLGLIALEEKNLDAAGMQFSFATGSSERSIRREAILNRADVQIRMGKFDDARAALEEINNKFPYGKQADRAILLLAKLSRKEGKPLVAVSLLKSLIFRRSPDSAGLDELESIILEAKDRDPNEFIKLWGEAGRWLLDPSRAKSIVTIARALRHEGKPFLDACAWLVKYGSEGEKTAGRFMLAEYYADLGDGATATAYFKQARIKDRNNDVARLQAKIYLAGKDMASASAVIMSIRNCNEEDLLRLLGAMRDLRNKKEAIAFCERALKGNTASASVLVRFADILYETGVRKKALDYYRAAITTKRKVQSEQETSVGDIEWAHYRIAKIAGQRELTESLMAIQTAKNTMGRFAAAELKGSDLRRKVEFARP